MTNGNVLHGAAERRRAATHAQNETKRIQLLPVNIVRFRQNKALALLITKMTDNICVFILYLSACNAHFSFRSLCSRSVVNFLRSKWNEREYDSKAIRSVAGAAGFNAVSCNLVQAGKCRVEIIVAGAQSMSHLQQ